MIKAVVDAGADPAAAQAKADLASALTPEALTQALELPPGAVQVVDPVTVEEAFVAAEGANAKNSVSLDFTVTADAFDPNAASLPFVYDKFEWAHCDALGVHLGKDGDAPKGDQRRRRG